MKYVIGVAILVFVAVLVLHARKSPGPARIQKEQAVAQKPQSQQASGNPSSASEKR